MGYPVQRMHRSINVVIVDSGEEAKRKEVLVWSSGEEVDIFIMMGLRKNSCLYLSAAV